METYAPVRDARYRGHPGAQRRAALGFTLLEMLIAVLVIALGLTAVLRSLQRSLEALHEARDALHASRLLSEALAALEGEVRGRPPGTPAPASGRDGLPWGTLAWDRDVLPAADIPTISESSCPAQDLAVVRFSVHREGQARRWTWVTMVRTAAPPGEGEP